MVEGLEREPKQLKQEFRGLGLAMGHRAGECSLEWKGLLLPLTSATWTPQPGLTTTLQEGLLLWALL